MRSMAMRVMAPMRAIPVRGMDEFFPATQPSEEVPRVKAGACVGGRGLCVGVGRCW